MSDDGVIATWTPEFPDPEQELQRAALRASAIRDQVLTTADGQRYRVLVATPTELGTIHAVLDAM